MTVVNNAPGGGMEPQRDREGTLVHVVETLLDKGLVLNADIMVSVAGVELLGIRIRAALASFETAARYGLEFPAGTNTETAAWQNAVEAKESCPNCQKKSPVSQLLRDQCPWCGWQSALALQGGSEAQSEREQFEDEEQLEDDDEQYEDEEQLEDSDLSEPAEEQPEPVEEASGGGAS